LLRRSILAWDAPFLLTLSTISFPKKYLTASGASFRAAATYICGNLELNDRDKNEKSSMCFLELINWLLSVDFLLF
jgi:hypothetical protein